MRKGKVIKKKQRKGFENATRSDFTVRERK